jgi:hypothetical protein
VTDYDNLRRLAEASAGTGTTNARLRHVVELDAQGQPKDAALCGYLWDQLHVPHNGAMCQECVDELRERGQG